MKIMCEKGLYRNWLEIEKKEKTISDAIRMLNEVCGTRYTKSWPETMKSRGYSLERLPTEVRRYMMAKVLPELIPGKSEEEYREITLNLT